MPIAVTQLIISNRAVTSIIAILTILGHLSIIVISNLRWRIKDNTVIMSSSLMYYCQKLYSCVLDSFLEYRRMTTLLYSKVETKVEIWPPNICYQNLMKVWTFRCHKISESLLSLNDLKSLTVVQWRDQSIKKWPFPHTN